MKLFEAIKYRKPLKREFWSEDQFILFTDEGVMIETKSGNGTVVWIKWKPTTEELTANDWVVKEISIPSELEQELQATLKSLESLSQNSINKDDTQTG